MDHGNGNKGKKSTALRRRKKGWIAAAIILLLLLLLAGILVRSCSNNAPIPVVSDISTTVFNDTAVQQKTDTVIIADSMPQEKAATDTTVLTAVKVPVRPEEKAATVPVATVDTVTAAASMADTAEIKNDACENDSTQLWVYPDPSGGLHYAAVRILFVSSKPATIHYRTGSDTAWHLYDGSAVVLDTSTTLYYDAIDSCGNFMERRSEYYEFEKKDVLSPCHPDMEQVKVGGMNFCIDRYEWPNRKGKKPQSFVSYYQAADSCFTAGKRLCSSDEWSVACSGPYSWKYPYGQKYERYGCSTHDSSVQASGSKPECRSFSGVYDMSGNLLEWTTTKSAENSAFYYVAGGFWESGPKSSCFDKRYSYYPQNQHNPVGFRCCRDIGESSAKPAGIGK